MSIFLVDVNDAALNAAVERVKSIDGVSEVMGMKVDVGKVGEVVAMREKVLDVFGEVSDPLSLIPLYVSFALQML